MIESKLQKLEQNIGYTFQNRKLLIQALSHSSYVNERRIGTGGDNERLEFLGDAVLEVASSDYLYHHYPKLPEGKLTKLRASIVCEPTLALCAKAFDLPRYLLLGKGEEHTGGRRRDSIVSDALEAVIGAIYLDGGLEPAKAFVERFVMTDIEHKKLFYDSKTILQEIIQRDRQVEISYVHVGQVGPDHAKTFLVELFIGGEKVGSGRGSTKKSAEQEAAYQALCRMGVGGHGSGNRDGHVSGDDGNRDGHVSSDGDRDGRVRSASDLDGHGSASDCDGRVRSASDCDGHGGDGNRGGDSDRSDNGSGCGDHGGNS